MPQRRDRFVWIMSRIVAPVLLVLFVILGVVYSVYTYTPAADQNRTKRVYYIAATEIVWDYAPAVETEENGSDQAYVDQHLSESNDPPRIGKSYLKAVFRQYTDNTYQTESNRPEWLGILGPVIAAEVGDDIEIHFFNNATIPLSIHPHGLFYTKSNEGAYYQDNTTESQKVDDAVPPGERYVYQWNLPEFNGPTSSDPDCLTMAYHSHHRSDTDVHSGLIGPLLICKKSSLHNDVPKDANQTIFLLFLIFDENDSWYIDKNINARFPSLNSSEIEQLKDDEEFTKSNLMYSINGLGFNSLKGLSFCIGEKISWRLIGMGNEIDLHSVTFQQHLIMIGGHRTNVVSIAPAKFSTSYMTARKAGKWKVMSETGDQFLAGMETYFTVRQCDTSHLQNSPFTIPSNPRTYYLTVEEVEWNYAPSGVNKMNNESLTSDEDASVFFERGDNRIGGTYKKALYVEYEDAEFSNMSRRAADELHLGFLGPTLRVEEGEAIKLVFKNNANRSYGIYSPGVEIYDHNSKSVYEPIVEPTSTAVFYWYVPEYYAPSETDPQCLTWRYYSTANFIHDAYSGLNGVLLTCKTGTLDENGKQKNVDKEFSLLFAIINENESPYIQHNIRTYCDKPESVNLLDADFEESNTMHAINGRMYGNLEGLTMLLNDTVSWHVIAMGKETDMHTVYFHGQTFKQYGIYRDTLALFPSTHHTAIMVADHVGEWELECKTVDHHIAGMRALYEITGTDGNQSPGQVMGSGRIRRYYLAAVEKEWNYAPHDLHLITGENVTDNEESSVFVTRGDHRIGRMYKKIIYELYSDAEFSVPVQKPSHLGLLGPMIEAEVDDVIEIVFKNMAANRSYSVHLHGVKAISDIGPTPPNEIRTYSWKALKRSGPGGSEFNCTSWSYYSDVNAIKDTNSGLIGPLVICRRDTLNESGKRRDVNHEFGLLFSVFDENLSWYLEENIRTYCGKPNEVDVDDEDFKESNLKHAINGRIYGSLEGMEVQLGDRVAWYLIGLGNEVDIHTAHIHGITFVSWENGEHRGDVVELSPGVFETVEMKADNPGNWLLHCHVDDHVKAGMNALFVVKE
uniref:Hephaestin-like protein n=1 Tax=Hadrurus spadix TaxID=141984 RepID=A0A1W7RAF4_9SCOR